MVINLGSIKKVSLNSIWSRENLNLWLSENIELLAERIGIEIIDIKNEEFNVSKLDIIGKDANSNRIVGIKSHLNSTEHDHLGQLISCSAGIDAAIIILLAKKIKKEHIVALEWLNKNSLANISFYGVEIIAFAIDDSKPAVDFKPIVVPNNLARELKKYNTFYMTKIEQYYIEFFKRLIEEYVKIDNNFKKLRFSSYNLIKFDTEKTGLTFGWAFRMGNRFSVELQIDTGDKKNNEDIFLKLLKSKEDIEKVIKDIKWENIESKKDCKIVKYKEQSSPIIMLSNEEIKELIEWGRDTMKQFKDIFSIYLNTLN